MRTLKTSRLLLQVLAWATALATGLGAVVLVMKHSSDRLLASHAEQLALQHARLFMQLVPGLERGFAGQGYDEAARDQMRRLLGAGDVFRFKLFDREGRAVLVSDELSLAAPAVTRQVLGGDHGAASPIVRDLVLGGQPFIELKRGTPPQRPDYYSEAYVPLVRSGHTVGVVEVYVDQTLRARAVADSQLRVSAAVAAVLLLAAGAAAWMAWRRVRVQMEAQRRIEYLAQHDVLSGALNRASFADALGQARWRAQQGAGSFAVICLDLDRFKDINDTLGHAIGDDVLRQVGERLRALAREGDHVARLGGDEFALLQGGVGRPDAVTRLAQRIVEALGQPYECGSHVVHTGASVGAAVYGTDATEVEELMHKADLALYRAKSQGRGCFSFYDAALDEQLRTRRALAGDLADAIEHDGLSLHFQPLFEQGGERLVGYEALARWIHPTRGPVSPGDFVPLAEEVGLIDRLGRWVLHQACREAASWPEPLSVAVNLSAAQFRRDDPVAAVSEALAASGLAAHRLELEITESLLMSNTESVLATLDRLSRMGVRIAMDDFGTGYSSLAYLWRYPFDKLKIDRAFVQGLERDPKVNLIVKSIIGLAHAMNIRVNAEGVETPTQLRWLQEHGCDELQGYLLGRPGPMPRAAEPAAAEAERAGAVLPGTPATAAL